MHNNILVKVYSIRKYRRGNPPIYIFNEEIKIAITFLFTLAFIFIVLSVNIKGSKDLVQYSKEDEEVEVLIERTNSITS